MLGWGLFEVWVSSKSHGQSRWLGMDSSLCGAEEHQGPAFTSEYLPRSPQLFGLRSRSKSVVGNINVEGGVHLLIGIARRRVFHDGNVIAELSGIPDCCFHANVCDQPDNDQPLNTVALELQIQIRVGKTT